MGNWKGGPDLTRRTFLTSATALAATTQASWAQTDRRTELRVLTKYEGLRLSLVRLMLVDPEAPETDPLELTITPESFGPGRDGPPLLTLSGLRKTIGSSVDPASSFTLSVSGVDGFNHHVGNREGPSSVARPKITLTLKFKRKTASQLGPLDDPAHPAWMVKLTSNYWRHDSSDNPDAYKSPGNRASSRPERQWYALSFDGPDKRVKLGERWGSFAPLQTVMRGGDLFSVTLSRRWTTPTLSQVIGTPVTTSGTATIRFGFRPTGGATTCRWRVERGRDQSFTLSMFRSNRNLQIGAPHHLIEATAVSFGWGFDELGEPWFDARLFSGAMAEHENSVQLSKFGWDAAGSQRSRVTLIQDDPAPPMPQVMRVRMFCHTRNLPDRAAPDREIEARVTDMFFEGKCRLQMQQTDPDLRTLFDVGLTPELPEQFEPSTLADSKHLALIAVDSSGTWRLSMREPEADAAGLGLPQIGADAPADPKVDKLPILAERPVFDALTTQSFGAIGLVDRSISLSLSCSTESCLEFGLQARPAVLPAWTSDDNDETGLLLGRMELSEFNRRAWPVFRIADTVLPSGMGGSALRAGEIWLDRANADLSLDTTTLSLRRARDFTRLDLRFAHMRVRWDEGRGRFVLYEEPEIAAAEARAPGLPAGPVMVVEFPPQHMAEEAYFRRSYDPAGVPDLDWLETARAVATKFPDIANVEETLGLLETVEKAALPERIEARRTLRARLESWFEQRGDLEDADLAKQIAEMQEYGLPNTGLLIPLIGTPGDQAIFIGARFMDPDVARRAWVVADEQAATDQTTRIRNWLEHIETEHETIAGLVRGRAEAAGYNPAALTPAQDREIHLAIAEDKDRLAPDYSVFRDFWRDGVALAPALQALDPGVAEFASVRWAEEHPEGIVREQFKLILLRYADPGGALSEPFKTHTRARWSGKSRIAYHWAALPNEDQRAAGLGMVAEFSIARLLRLDHMAQSVTRRARMLTEPDEQGKGYRRVIDDARFLEFQGFQPSAGKTSSEHMAELYVHASRGPTAYETALEIPFRLQLSPAGDVSFSTEAPVDSVEGLFDLEKEKLEQHDGRLIFSLSLPTEGPNVHLRAVWSDDFRPETLVGPGARLNPETLAATTGKDEAELLNTVFDLPRRGLFAPWAEPQVRRIDGRIEGVTRGADSADGAGVFRACMDSYDRDQIVKLSSVHGLPTRVGRAGRTLDLRKDADSFDPPDNFQLIDLETTLIQNEEGHEIRRDLSAFYRPPPLDYRELTLMAPGGSLNLDTSFQPPISAKRADGAALFDTLTLERWRHRAVVGRDIKVELVYRGYLFPFGNRAALIKVTERDYDGRDPNDDRGPTAYLTQRLFIRVSEPRKERWFDQPLAGRSWPCRAFNILTTETPDLTDVLSAPPVNKDDMVLVDVTGRIALGKEAKGLVFWPRSFPTEAGNVGFEFQIDDRGQKMRMPLIFVDNEAAHHPPTLHALCDYYNAQSERVHDSRDGPSPDIDRENVCVMSHGGTARRYATEVEEGDTSYETLHWVIGAEGRPGPKQVPHDPLKGLSGSLRQARSKALGQPHENFDFGPLLIADDQPPFYPFIRTAVLRLDRIARLVGQREGQRCVAAFDRAYLVHGLAATEENGETKSIGGPFPFLDLVSDVRLDVGPKGDRIGAIGRPAGRLIGLSRKEGPVTSRPNLLTDTDEDLTQSPPDFARQLNPRLAVDLPTLDLPKAVARQGSREQDEDRKMIEEAIRNIVGDGDTKVLGVFELTEIIKYALCNLKDNVPVISETLDYAENMAASLVQVVRDMASWITDALDQAEQEFRDAALAVGDERLEIARVYPDVGTGMNRLRAALREIEDETNPTRAAELLPKVPTAGKALLEALEDLARDPISPLKLELQRLFLSELRDLEKIRDAIDQIRAVLDNPNTGFDRVQKDILSALGAEVLNNLPAVAEALFALSPMTSLPVGPGIRISDNLKGEIVAFLGRLLEAVVERTLAPYGDQLTVNVVARNIDALNTSQLLLDALDAAQPEGSSLYQALDAEILDPVEAKAAPYVAAVRSVVAELQRLKVLADTYEDRINFALGGLEEELRGKAKRQLDEFKERVEAELNGVADAALKRILGIDRRRLNQSIKTLESHVATLKGPGGIEPKGRAVVGIAVELDAVFVNGTYKKAADAKIADLTKAATAAVGEAIGSANRAYREFAFTLLDLYEGTIRHSTALTQGISPGAIDAVPEYLDDAKAALGQLREASQLGTKVTDGAEDWLETVEKASLTARAALMAAEGEAEFKILNDFMADFGRAHTALHREVRRETGQLGEALSSLMASVMGIHQFLADALNGLGGVHARGIAAFTAYQTASSDTLAEIAAVRLAIEQDALPRPQRLEDLANRFPKAEVMEMLDAWPAIARESLQVLANLGTQAAGLFATITDEKIKVIDVELDRSGVDAAVKTALDRLILDLKASILRFGYRMARLAMEQLRQVASAKYARELASIEQFQDDKVKALAEAQVVVEKVAGRLEAQGDAFPLFEPVLDQIASSLRAMTALPDLSKIERALDDVLGAYTAFESNPGDATKRKVFVRAVEGLDGPENPFKALVDRTLAAAGQEGQDSVALVGLRIDGVRDVVIARGLRAVAALETAGGEAAEGALEFAVGQVFNRVPIEAVEKPWAEVLKQRREALAALNKNLDSVAAIRNVTAFLGLGVGGQGIDVRHLLLALAPGRLSAAEIGAEKDRLLKAGPDMPADLLSTERGWMGALEAKDNGAEQVRALREMRNIWRGGPEAFAVLQIIQNIVQTVDSIASADISRLVDFRRIGDVIENEIRKLIPSRRTIKLNHNVPIGEFAGIFVPRGQGTLTISSINTVDISDVLSGTGSTPQLAATANAVLSPFDVRLLGSFDALTIMFSEARMSWTLGQEPSFSLDFLDYRIGKELEFVQELAKSLSVNAGGAYVRPASGMLGIEAGYGLNIPAINLGGVTFANVGLSAYARLPFDKGRAQLGAALSTRQSPFLIYAGVWGGGGHFGLTSDGRRIVGFDASFKFGGGGAVSYGPLTLTGRVDVGVFIRKIGSMTEMSGDFFAGGSGRIAIFGISASLTVTMGMDATGAMTGSAVFRFSFSIGFAKIRFAITIFKKEGKGFEGSGSKRASLGGHQRRPYRIAAAVDGVPQSGSGWTRKARIRVDTHRQDQDFRAWSRYFSTARPMGYANVPQ